MKPINKLSNAELAQLLSDGRCALKNEKTLRARAAIQQRMKEAEEELSSRTVTTF